MPSLATQAKATSKYATIGLMMDYMCLPQKPFASPNLKEQFRISLSHINEWYFHTKTIVILVTSPAPEGAEYSNTRLHGDRGWYVGSPIF